MAEKLTQGIVQEWMSQTGGRYVSIANMRSGMDIQQSDNVSTLHKSLQRLSKMGILKHHPIKYGYYRYVDVNAEKMDLVTANPLDIVPIKFPFGVERYVRIYKKNVIVYYGSKDAGKTAQAINLMRWNLSRLPQRYINTDMGEEELRGRLEKLPDVTIEQWQKYVDFRWLGDHAPEDLIDPDAINILDFLEVFADFYAVGRPIKEMASKLRDGILVVFLQKNPGADLPLGKGRGLEKAKLAFNLDPGKITIVVAKNWAEGITTSPVGKSWTYKLVGGARIFGEKEAT
uniref:Uncharacterized protein n=1 Tax=viral metagenome TaxID=1070528 RepID=A0A6H2A3F4_9ZZZZ